MPVGTHYQTCVVDLRARPLGVDLGVDLGVYLGVDVYLVELRVNLGVYLVNVLVYIQYTLKLLRVCAHQGAS